MMTEEKNEVGGLVLVSEKFGVCEHSEEEKRDVFSSGVTSLSESCIHGANGQQWTLLVTAILTKGPKNQCKRWSIARISAIDHRSTSSRTDSKKLFCL